MLSVDYRAAYQLSKIQLKKERATKEPLKSKRNPPSRQSSFSCDQLAMAPSKRVFLEIVLAFFRVSEVRDYFQVFGELRDVYLPKDYYTKEMKGVAYVE